MTVAARVDPLPFVLRLRRLRRPLRTAEVVRDGERAVPVGGSGIRGPARAEHLKAVHIATHPAALLEGKRPDKDDPEEGR